MMLLAVSEERSRITKEIEISRVHECRVSAVHKVSD